MVTDKTRVKQLQKENARLRTSLQTERELNRLHCEAQNDLGDKVERLEREAARVLGAVVYYGCGGQVTLSDDVLLDDYAVQREPDRCATVVRFRAWPTR